jgi:hypothetical protein
LVLTCSPTPSFPAAHRARRFDFPKIAKLSIPHPWLRAEGRCGNGYRFAKPQGKPNSANPAADQQNKRFLDFCGGTTRNPFRFDSSRSLNCSSNLIGHDHPDKPANGGGE